MSSTAFDHLWHLHTISLMHTLTQKGSVISSPSSFVCPSERRSVDDHLCRSLDFSSHLSTVARRDSGVPDWGISVIIRGYTHNPFGGWCFFLTNSSFPKERSFEFKDVME